MLEVNSHNDDYIEKPPVAAASGVETSNLGDMRSAKKMMSEGSPCKIVAPHNFIYGVKIQTSNKTGIDQDMMENSPTEIIEAIGTEKDYADTNEKYINHDKVVNSPGTVEQSTHRSKVTKTSQ